MMERHDGANPSVDPHSTQNAFEEHSENATPKRNVKFQTDRSLLYAQGFQQKRPHSKTIAAICRSQRAYIRKKATSRTTNFESKHFDSEANMRQRKGCLIFTIEQFFGQVSPDQGRQTPRPLHCRVCARRSRLQLFRIAFSGPEPGGIYLCAELAPTLFTITTMQQIMYENLQYFSWRRTYVYGKADWCLMR